MQLSSKPGFGISYSIPPSSQYSHPAPRQASMMSMPSAGSGGEQLLGAGPGVPRPASKPLSDTPPPFYHANAAAPGDPSPNRFIDNDTTLFTNTSPSGISTPQQRHSMIGAGGARNSPAVVAAGADPSLGSVMSSRTGHSGTRGQVMDREGLEEALDEIYDHRILFLGRFELYSQVQPPPPIPAHHRTAPAPSPCRVHAARGRHHVRAVDMPGVPPPLCHVMCPPCPVGHDSPRTSCRRPL